MDGVEKSDERRVVCCVGDIHGYASKLRRLWSNMEARVGPTAFSTALIIFLGDYCDRGPHTDEVIDFLLSLPSLHPFQSHVFLCGNHDFAFAAFVKALPTTTTNIKSTWEEYGMYEEREGWFRGEGFESMHLQGRRWGGLIKERWNANKGTEYKGSIYDAAPTFLSYNVPHGSHELVKAVPEDHKKFLADLVWVHEEDDVYIDTSEGTLKCKLVAVHAGLDKSKDVQQQIRLLKQRDTSISKVEALSGRQSVWDIPKELAEKQTIVVSGHHGKLHIDGLRLIIDESGGLEEYPIAAVVLPSLMIVRDTDDVANQA